MKNDKYTYKDLLNIVAKLRAPDGCPWDREQDHKSLKRYLIEESYEVLEAIDEESPEELCEELGDLLLQVLLHSQIAKEDGKFDMDDVVDCISKKMISRHSHVFGGGVAEDTDDVMKIWERAKRNEKGIETQTEVLNNVPKNLPALLRSYKVQEKAAQVGFDWDDVKDAFLKVKEEETELEEAYLEGNGVHIEEELGDLLFAVVNVSRFLNVQSELALSATVNKFIRRFEYVEKRAEEQGHHLKNMSLEDMDALWDEAKIIEKS